MANNFIQDFSEFMVGDLLRVSAKPGKRKTRVVGFSDEKKSLIIEIGEPAEDNKANIEIIKFLSKQFGRKCRIKSGLKSKEKIIDFKSS